LKFIETSLSGAFIVEPEQLKDERGFFARTFCRREFEARGLETEFIQHSISYNHKQGIVRGMHYQADPYQEVKLVRCTRGSIYDVILDLRESSPTYCQWQAVELTDDNWQALYIPEGFAHGFQTLSDHCEVLYQISQYYQPDAARGVRWDDPAFGINWPISAPILSDRDRSFGDFVR